MFHHNIIYKKNDLININYINEMNSYNQLVQGHQNNQPITYTPAQKPFVSQLEEQFNQAVQNGLEPEKVKNLTCIMCMVLEKGISLDHLQQHLNLFLTLCINSDFSIMDHNVNHIVGQLKLV